METNIKSLRYTALMQAYWSGYRVTQSGSVISPRGRELKPQHNPNGYMYFNISYNGKTVHVDIHRLQALQKFGWHALTRCGLEVRHLDQNKHNNHVNNIALGTHQQNCNETPKHLLWNVDQRAPVACKRGNIINYFPSIYEAAKFTGVNGGSISKVCNGKRTTAGGLVWFYLPKIKPIGTYK